MSLNDIYRITCTQIFTPSSQVCLNVFYYKQVTAGALEGAAALLDEFDGSLVRDKIRAIQNENVNWLQILVENIVPSSDNAQADYALGAVAGNRSGEALPPYAAWAFRLNRQTNESRHGQKRFVGVSEGDQVDGVAEAALTTDLTAVATALESTLGGPPPGAATFQPVIFRQGKPSVTIPEKIVPAVIQSDFPISTAQYVSVSTQNTRKTNA